MPNTNKKRNKKPMDPIDIQFALKKARVSQADIARELKVSQAMVSLTIKGSAKSNKVQKCIAKHINKSTREIWPPPRLPGNFPSGQTG